MIRAISGVTLCIALLAGAGFELLRSTIIQGNYICGAVWHVTVLGIPISGGEEPRTVDPGILSQCKDAAAPHFWLGVALVVASLCCAFLALWGARDHFDER
jgi:hypothetical protein